MWRRHRCGKRFQEFAGERNYYAVYVRRTSAHPGLFGCPLPRGVGTDTFLLALGFASLATVKVFPVIDSTVRDTFEIQHLQGLSASVQQNIPIRQNLGLPIATH